MSACLDEVALWMRSNRLQLNTSKTEVLWCATSRIYIDSDASMRTHVSKTVSNCFAALRQLRSIRQSVSRQVLLSMVVSLVLQRLDFGNATLADLPAYQLSRLQSVLNAAA